MGAHFLRQIVITRALGSNKVWVRSTHAGDFAFSALWVPNLFAGAVPASTLWNGDPWSNVLWHNDERESQKPCHGSVKKLAMTVVANRASPDHIRQFLCFFIFTRLPRTCICKASKETVHSPRIPTYSNPHRAAPKFIAKIKGTSLRTIITHNNSHVGFKRAEQGHGAADFSIVSNPSATTFSARNCKILNNKFWSLALRSQMSKHDVTYNPGFEGLDMTPSTCHIPTLNSTQFHPSLEQNHRQMETDLQYSSMIFHTENDSTGGKRLLIWGTIPLKWTQNKNRSMMFYVSFGGNV